MLDWANLNFPDSEVCMVIPHLDVLNLFKVFCSYKYLTGNNIWAENLHNTIT